MSSERFGKGCGGEGGRRERVEGDTFGEKLNMR